MYVYFQKLSRALKQKIQIHNLSRISRTRGNPKKIGTEDWRNDAEPALTSNMNKSS